MLNVVNLCSLILENIVKWFNLTFEVFSMWKKFRHCDKKFYIPFCLTDLCDT